MKRPLILLTAIFIVGTVHSQEQYLESNKVYSDARVYQRGTSMLKVKDMVLVNDSILQYKLAGHEGSTGQNQIPVNNIRYVGIKKGHHAVSYGAYGAVLGLLSSLYGVLDVKNDPYLNDSGVNWTPFIVGFTAGGGALGAIIGLFVPKWQMLYIQPKSTACSIKISPDINRDFYGLGVNIKF